MELLNVDFTSVPSSFDLVLGKTNVYFQIISEGQLSKYKDRFFSWCNCSNSHQNYQILFIAADNFTTNICSKSVHVLSGS